MANPTDPRIEPVNNEKPTQGIFMGNLALVLLVVAVIVAAVGLYAGAVNG